MRYLLLFCVDAVAGACWDLLGTQQVDFVTYQKQFVKGRNIYPQKGTVSKLSVVGTVVPSVVMFFHDHSRFVVPLVVFSYQCFKYVNLFILCCVSTLLATCFSLQL